MKLQRNIVRCGLLVLTVCVVLSSANAAQKPKLVGFWNDHEASSRLKPDHSAWQTLLDKYVLVDEESGVNRFAYDAVTPDDVLSLRSYLFYLQNLDPRQLNKPAQKAFWLNMYNASVTLIVIAQKPRNSIRSVDSRKVWEKERFNIALQSLSLDTIEHGVLRPLFADERILFALHKASIGGANISKVAFTAENIEQQLDAARQDFLKHSRSIDFRGNSLVLSRMFKWYEDDFGGDVSSVREYLKKHVEPETALKIERARNVRYQYDWNLNRP